MRTWPLRLASRLRFFMRRTGSAVAASAAAEAADALSAALLPSPADAPLWLVMHYRAESSMCTRSCRWKTVTTDMLFLQHGRARIHRLVQPERALKACLMCPGQEAA